jgi:hypothetical protein
MKGQPLYVRVHTLSRTKFVGCTLCIQSIVPYKVLHREVLDYCTTYVPRKCETIAQPDKIERYRYVILSSCIVTETSHKISRYTAAGNLIDQLTLLII